MIPFARISKYGNTLPISPPWYTDSNVVMAWDGNNFSSNGFTDYVGNTMTLEMQNAGYLRPNLMIDSTGPYGTNIINLAAGLVSSLDSTVLSVQLGSSQSFTVDFWQRQISNGSLETIPFGHYITASNNNPKLMAWFPFNPNVYYQYAGTSTSRSGTLYAGLSTNVWKHILYSYDSVTKNSYFFINGVQVDTFTFTFPTPTGATRFGIGGHVNNNGSNHTYVDRYRVRKDLVVNANFSLTNLYP